jgi:hypothetical protein
MTHRHRRLSSEYVRAMAHLYQKSGKRSATLKHIQDEFRRNLAAQWHINPMLDTPSFVYRKLLGEKKLTPTNFKDS